MIFSILNISITQEEAAMSFCDFAENVEDAIDQGCAYHYEENGGKVGPQLLWLSDIPLFQSTKPAQRGGHSYLDDDDDDTELQCTYQSQRVAYRPEEDERREQGEEQGDGKRREVLAKPEDFNKNSSFVMTYAEVPVAFQAVRQILTCDSEYAFTVVNGDYKINVTIGDNTRFAMSFYEDEIPGQTFVEITFNSGNRMEFLTFYREFIRHLKDVGLPEKDTFHTVLPTDTFAFSPVYQEELERIDQDVKKAELRELRLPAVSVGNPDCDDWGSEWI